VVVSKQIAVRLPDEVVDFIDSQVRDGDAASRAAFVQNALERERRRLIAARDAEILSRDTKSDDFESLAAFAANLPTDLE
jgi:Arc/MetJ-type ribon-helix-helix transcriptional regulator